MEYESRFDTIRRYSDYLDYAVLATGLLGFPWALGAAVSLGANHSIGNEISDYWNGEGWYEETK